MWRRSRCTPWAILTTMPATPPAGPLARPGVSVSARLLPLPPLSGIVARFQQFIVLQDLALMRDAARPSLSRHSTLRRL
jgi:hypothetical protein